MMQFLFTKTPLAYLVASFWRDEAFSYLMAKLPLTQLLWSTAKDANPPLYYLLLKGWMGIFGSSELAIRSLSIIFFWATVYVAFLIMNEVFKLSTKKSTFYLLFFIANPILHYYAFEARMYSMMAFCATLLFYALMKKNYRLYSFVALCSFYTHYFLILVVGFQMVYVFVTAKKSEQVLFFKTVFKTSFWVLPWIVVLLSARPPVGQSFWIQSSRLQDVFLIPAIIMTGYEQGTGVIFPYLLPLSLLLCGLIGYGYFLHKVQHKQQLMIMTLGWAVGIPLAVFILSFWKPVFLPRYLIFSSVGFLLLVILSIESMKNKYIKSVMCIFILTVSIVYAENQAVTRIKAPLKQVFSSIKQEMGPNDVVYVTHEYDYHPALYYLPTKKVYIYKKTYEELPWFVGKVLMDKSAFKQTLPIYPERAFVLSGNSFSIQSSL